MTADRFRRVEAVFRLVSSADPSSRVALLDSTCGDDPALRREVEELLAADAAPPSYVRETAVGAFAARSAAEALEDDPASLPAQIGPYAVLGVIGTGGMGVVYRAVQSNPPREVALKVLRAGGVSTPMVRRFEHEARLLARLDHPAIAHVYEAGTWSGPDGRRPWFAMELVRGMPLTEYAGERGLPLHRRLELFAMVCDGVQHAHQKGVIHRDLKPGNILVTEGDGDMPRPRILDFGVARLMEADRQLTALHTAAGEVIGTLPYMSPEQVAGSAEDVDTRADVYALGVILYELVCGVRPIDVDGLGIAAAARRIAEEEPVRLGTRDRALRGDVEAIAAHALEKDPARRYQSAGELAEDVRRCLRHEPVAARAPGAVYQLRKLARRNPAAAIAGLTALLVLILGAAGTTTGMIWALRARDLSERHRREADEVAAFQSAVIENLNPRFVGEILTKAVVASGGAQSSSPDAPARATDSDVAATPRWLAEVNPTSLGTAVLGGALLEPALKQIDTRFASAPLVRARLLHTMSRSFLRIGDHQRAIDPARRAFEIRSQSLGPGHADTLRSQFLWADMLRKANRNDEAAPVFNRLVQECERSLGADDALTLQSQTSLAWVEQAQGEGVAAEQRMRRVLERQRRSLGESHPDVQMTLAGVGVMLEKRGSLDEAETALREAVELGRHHPVNHPGTVYCMHSLARTLLKRGKLDEAETHLRRVCERNREFHGPDSPQAFESFGNLARVYSARGRHAEAEALLRDQIAIASGVLSPGDPLHQWLRHWWADELEKLGRRSEAEEAYRGLLMDRRRSLGRHHPDTCTTVAALTRLLAAEGRVAELEGELTADLTRSVQSDGPDHWRTAAVELEVGAMLAACGRYADAEPMLTHAHRVSLGAPEAPRGFTDRCVGALVRLYSRWDTAEPGRGHGVKAKELVGRPDVGRVEEANPESADRAG